MKRNLAYWRALDADVKRRFDEWTKRPIPGVPTLGTDAWVMRQVSLAFGVPLLLTPLVTLILYPWLPQPDGLVMLWMGMGALGVALAAHHEYKKAQQSGREVSEHPPATGKDASEMPSEACLASEDSTPTKTSLTTSPSASRSSSTAASTRTK